MTTSTNKSFKSLVEAKGSVSGSMGSNIAMTCDTAMLVVMQMIIADQNGASREVMFKSEMKCFGSFSDKHSKLKNMTCVVYTGGFTPK
jgi:hypothetical protein